VVSDTESHITASVRHALPLSVTLEYLLAGNEAKRWVDHDGVGEQLVPLGPPSKSAQKHTPGRFAKT
jgi:hypothetical protein